MKNFLSEIKKSPLFWGIEETELEIMLTCLSARRVSYEKNKFIYHAGDSFSSVGMVLSGCVHVVKEDFWGNRSIFSVINPGGIFGETLALSSGAPSVLSIVAAADTVVMLLDIGRVTTVCSSACKFHSRLISNLLRVISEENRLLTRKMEHLTKRTTREKLLSYLSEESQKAGSSNFEIPLNRTQLAEYLSVDRSAMSNELCKMRDAGILEFNRNKFVLRHRAEGPH